MDEQQLVQINQGESTTKCLQWGVGVTVVLTCIAGLLIVYFVNPSNSSKIINIFAISDLHFDPQYNPYSTQCRGINDSTEPANFGRYGCATPEATFNSMVNYVNDMKNKPTFILLGGDNIADNLSYTREQNDDLQTKIVKKLKDTFGNIPILPVVGGTEYLTKYGSFANDATDFQSFNNVLGGSLSDSEKKTFVSGGYYYRDFTKFNIRLLFLNTAIYSAKRPYDSSNTDPYSQFKFIREKGKEAESKHMGLGAVMYLPPTQASSTFADAMNADYYNELIASLNEVKTSFIISGYTHADSMFPVYTNTSKASIMTAPSVSPQNGNNPAFRLLRIRAGVLEDFDQYYMDFSTKSQNWQLEYSFSSGYSVKSATQENLNKAINWVSSTGEGRWRFKERTYARANNDNDLYYCLLSSQDKDASLKCVNEL